MTKSAEEVMNDIKIYELIALHVEGLCLICGNGQAVAIIPEDRAELAEVYRCEQGY